MSQSTKARPPASRQEEIERAAAALFRERSYHGTSLRELASAVGIEAASLYNHFASKQDLLVHLLEKANRALLESVREELANTGDSPQDRLRSAIRGFIGYFDGNLDMAVIANTELRALDPTNAFRVRRVKDEVLAIFTDIIAAGVDQDVFEVDDLILSAVFTVSMCSRVPAWYVEGGPLTLEDVADLAAEFALDALASYSD